MQEKDPFYISKRNRRGVILLACVLLPVIYFPRIYGLLVKPDKLEISISTLEESSQQLKAKEKKKFKPFKKKSFEKKSKYSAPPSKFDPNQYAVEDWMRLGLSQKQSEIIIKWGKYGFKSNEDLKKIFVINDELFELIKDSTFFPERTVFTKENTALKPKEEAKKFIPELNSTNEEELQKLKGIGPFFAKQIIKYRDRLGGFTNISQLMEVWKMNLETFEILEKSCKLNSGAINKLNLNEVTVEELKNHPYLTWNQANSIIKMRQQRGRYEKIEEIKESKLIDEETFLKVSPYLSL